MKRYLVILIFSSLTSTLAARSYGPFDGVKRIAATPQGHWVIRRSIDTRVYLDLETDYDGTPPEFSVIQQSDSLIIRQSSHPGSIHGKMPRWTLLVPDNTSITLRIAKGSVDVSDVDVQLSATTGNGDFKLLDLTGDITATTSSGSLNAHRIRGAVHFATAKGMITTSEMTLTGSSSLSASSDCILYLSAALQDDVEVKCVTGDAVIRFNGFPVEGLLTMQSGKKGSVRAPFPFDKTSDHREPGNNEQWQEKSVQLGRASFRIRVSTATGTAEIVK